MENLTSRSVGICMLASILLAPSIAHAFQTPVIAQANITMAPPNGAPSMPVAAASAPLAADAKLAPKPAASAPGLTASKAQEVTLPKQLEGVVSVAEFKKYLEYQNSLRNQPEIRVLNDKIMVHVKEMQVLQAELETLRKKALESNPGAKEVGEKIQKALQKSAPPMTTAPIPVKP